MPAGYFGVVGVFADASSGFGGMLCHSLSSIPGLQERSSASACGVDGACEPPTLEIPLFLDRHHERFNKSTVVWCEDCAATNQSDCDAFNADERDGRLKAGCLGLLRTRAGFFAHRSSFTQRLLRLLRDANAGLLEAEGIEACYCADSPDARGKEACACSGNSEPNVPAREYNDLVSVCPGEAETLCSSASWADCVDNATEGNYEGPLCAICGVGANGLLQEQNPSTLVCSPCETGNRRKASVGGGVLIVVVVLIVAARKKIRKLAKKVSKLIASLEKELSGQEDDDVPVIHASRRSPGDAAREQQAAALKEKQKQKKKARDKSSATKIKILVSTLQILGALATGLSVKWPANLSALLQSLNGIVNINLSSLLSVGCVVSWSFHAWLDTLHSTKFARTCICINGSILARTRPVHLVCGTQVFSVLPWAAGSCAGGDSRRDSTLRPQGD